MNAVTPTLPRLVALCGNPTCGKTTAAQILQDLYGYELVDDGGFLRHIAVDHFGAEPDDVHSQAGKLRTTTVNGAEMTWRDVLGRIGNAFEAQFGANVIPELAYNGLDPSKRYVFGSVRREQGLYHRSRGALVIEIRNPLAGPSPYEFDYFNRDACHAVVVNDALARGFDAKTARLDLRNKLVEALLRTTWQAAI